MPPVDEQITKINESVNKINQGQNVGTIPTINSSVLKDSKSFNFDGSPDPVATPQADALEGAVTGEDTFTQGLAENTKNAQTGRDDALSELMKTLEATPTFSELQLQAEQGTQLSEREAELLDINDQIRREQQSLRRAVERVQDKGGGFQGGAAIAVENLRRDSLRKQADLAIIQLSAQGRYDSAKAIADRQAKAVFEKQQRDLEIRQFLYQENKDLFTKAEQRQFEVTMQDRERKLSQERQDYVTLQNTKLEALKMAQTNNAPISVISAIQTAETPEQVLEVAGQYGSVDMLQRQIQNQQLSNALKEGRKKDYELAQLIAAEERRNKAIEEGTLLPEEFEEVDSVDKEFRAEPVVKEFNEAAARRFGFEEVVKNGVKGVKDMQLVYDFMKAVDPTSVVRESEFKTAAETGNIFAGKFTKFNEGYFGEGGFLPPEVQTSFLNAANSAWSGKQQQYFNVKEEFGKKIDRRFGVENGSEYLTSYEDAAPLDQAKSIESARSGQIVVVNGVRYLKQSDGTFKQITDD